MPTTAVKLPVDDGTNTGWNITGGASAAAVLADSSDLTYVTTDTPNLVCLCVVETLPADVTSITSVKGRIRGNCSGGEGHVLIYCVDNTAETDSSSAEIDLTISPTTSSYVTIPTPTGAAWTKEIFDRCVFGPKCIEISEFEDTMVIMKMDIQVTYEVAAAAATTTTTSHGSGRPYYRIHLTKDIKPAKVRHK